MWVQLVLALSPAGTIERFFVPHATVQSRTDPILLMEMTRLPVPAVSPSPTAPSMIRRLPRRPQPLTTEKRAYTSALSFAFCYR